MRLTPNELPAALKRGLAPLYLLSGAEPLLLDEAVDRVRTAARDAGFSERSLHLADARFNWSELQADACSQSLFASRRLIEVRMASSKPGAAGARVLKELSGAVPEDTLIMLVAGALDRSARRSAWVGALEKAGAWVDAPLLSVREQRAWIRGRLSGEGFQPDEAAVVLLAERTEGNLLSARQQIDKLALAHDPGPLSVEAVMEAIADASRFDVFQLGSAALGQDLRRTARILAGLKRERAPLTLILWVLVRDITTLADLYWRTARGDSLPSAMGALRVWSGRKAEFRSALKRHGARSVSGLLSRSARADQVIKGARPGEPWAELELLAFGLAEPHRMAAHSANRPS